MDIDDSDEDAIGSNDPRDMIVDGEESGSGEEEMDDEDDYEEAEEEEEEEEEEETIAPAKPSPVILRAPGPATVPTPRQSRGGPPVVSPAISANSTPGIKGGLRLRLNVGKPSPLGKTIAPPAEGSRRPAREAAKKAGKKSKEVAMEAALGTCNVATGGMWLIIQVLTKMRMALRKKMSSLMKMSWRRKRVREGRIWRWMFLRSLGLRELRLALCRLQK